MATTLLNSDLPVVSESRSNWVVQKFGGTSVGKFALNIIEQVIEYDALFNHQSMNTKISIDPAWWTTELLSSVLQEAVLPKPRALPTGESLRYDNFPSDENTNVFFPFE
jgi:aspartate kinase